MRLQKQTNEQTPSDHSPCLGVRSEISETKENHLMTPHAWVWLLLPPGIGFILMPHGGAGQAGSSIRHPPKLDHREKESPTFSWHRVRTSSQALPGACGHL